MANRYEFDEKLGCYRIYFSDGSSFLVYKEDFDTFRGSISQYALAKDNNNEYIYDETIAEAFHDVYLNKDQAVDASKYIEAVLKKYLNKVGE